MASGLSATCEDILTALAGGPLYGLAIAGLIEKHGGQSLSIGTLYPTLRRMERDGLLSGAWGEDEPTGLGGARRRYYSLTQEGRDRLEEVRDTRDALYYRRVPNKTTLAAIAESRGDLPSHETIEELMGEV